MENTRELALDMLLEITSGRAYSHKEIGAVMEKYNYMSGQEKAFLKRVTEGTIERMIQLDYIIDHFSKVPVKKMKPLIRNLMRMSVYQLLFMEKIPDSAVCNEAVKLAAKRKFQNLKGFVNGVLRSIARQKENVLLPEFYPDEKKEPVKALSVLYSCPEWLTEKWLSEYGTDTCKKILAELLEIKPVTIRVEETLKEEEKETIAAGLKAYAKRVENHPYLPYAFQVWGMEGLANVPFFSEGKITVQDISSMLAVEAAGIEAGMKVLDVCAAPGGKTLHAACKATAAGSVEGRDVTEEKTVLLEENKTRMNKQWITTKVWDATVFDESAREAYDVVLADVPCSGLGVMGKKRDIKYRATKEGLEKITVLQREIMENVWQYVKPGGVLLYSTCTINRKENEDMVQYLTEEFALEPESLDSFLPKELHSDTTAKGYLQLLPGVHLGDGFFIARFRRKDGLFCV